MMLHCRNFRTLGGKKENVKVKSYSPGAIKEKKVFRLYLKALKLFLNTEALKKYRKYITRTELGEHFSVTLLFCTLSLKCNYNKKQS